MSLASPSTVLSHIKQLSTHSAVYGIVGASSAGVSMILIPLYGHLLTPKEFGQLQLLQLWLSLASTIAGLGLTTAYFKLYHEHPSEEERQGTLGIMWILVAGSTSLGCLLLGVLSLQTLTDHFSLLHDPAILSLLLTSLVTGVFLGIPFQLLRAQEHSLEYLKLGALGLIAGLLLNVFFIWWLEVGVKGVLAAQSLSSFMMIIVAFPLLYRHTRLSFSPATAKTMLRFGLPLVPAALALWILEGSDRVVIERYWGPAEVGIYSLAYKYGIILQMALVAFQTAWAPQLFSLSKQEGASQLISRILTYFLTGMMLLATLLYVVRKPVLSLAASADFAGAESVVGPILLGFVFYGFYFVAISGSYIHGKTMSVALVVGLAAGLNILLNLLLIPTFGGLGAAWATAFSYLVLGGVMYWLSQQYFPMSLEWKPLGGASLCCLSVALVTNYLPTASWETWLVSLALVALIPVILWHGGFLTVAEREHLRTYLQGRKWAGDMP